MTLHKSWNCNQNQKLTIYRTQKLKLWQNSTEIVTKLNYSNWDKTQKPKLWQTSQSQIVTTQKHKFWYKKNTKYKKSFVKNYYAHPINLSAEICPRRSFPKVWSTNPLVKNPAYGRPLNLLRYVEGNAKKKLVGNMKELLIAL